MGQAAIEEKLDRELSAGAPFNEARVVYILVELRKYIDTREAPFRERYELLKMYCDWVVHVELFSNKHLVAMLQAFDADMDIPEGSPASPTLLKYSTLSEFRQEFGKFLREVNLPDFTSDSAQWKPFVHEYSQVVADCPLYTTRKNMQLRNVNKVQLCKEPNTSGLPKGVVALYKNFIDQFDI
jgi:hypothetical protein